MSSTPALKALFAQRVYINRVAAHAHRGVQVHGGLPVILQPLEDQFVGCVVGQAVGDALGYMVEAYPPSECATYVESLRRNELPEQGRGGHQFGQYTDDTQMARELIKSLLANGCFNPQDYAERIKYLFSGNRVVGRTKGTTELAVGKLLSGAKWQEAGRPSAGNASAMRAAPVGLAYYDDPESLIAVADMQGRITHVDSICSAGAIAVAAAVSFVMTSRPLEQDAFFHYVGECSKEKDRSFAENLRRLEMVLDMPPEDAVDEIKELGDDYTASGQWKGISPFVVGTVLWSFYSFLRSPDDYMETMYTSISVGGDVDTTAAIAGAISGAYNGGSVIPRHLREALTDRGTWGNNELTDLAKALYTHAVKYKFKEPIVT